MRKPKQPIPEEIRRKVLERDGYRCRYCGTTEGPFHMDHVYPESKGGETTAKNLVTACGKCNNSKRAKVGVWPSPLGYYEIVRLANDGEKLDKRVKDRHEKNIHLARFLIFLGISIAYLIPTSINTFMSVRNNAPTHPPVGVFTISIVMGLIPVAIGLVILVLNRKGEKH